MVQKKVALVHTSLAVLDVLNGLFDEILPDVARTHIIEHSLIEEIVNAGRVTTEAMRRMCGYFLMAEATGADAIFNVCTSVGDTAEVARHLVKVPIVRVDEAMAQQAVEGGQAIGVLATLRTSLEPTCRLLEATAQKTSKEIVLKRGLVEGAFDELIAGNIDKHDSMILSRLESLTQECDTVVLAQPSMGRLLKSVSMGSLPVPVLASPRLGVLHLKRVLDSL